MKNFNLIACFLSVSLFLLIPLVSINAQVGIGTTTPQATLDITGEPTDATVLDGVIPPRITGDQLRAKTYTATQTAAVVYVTAADSAPAGQTIGVTQTGYYFFNGTVWIILAPYEDGDFHEEGTSTAPTAITQDVFRTGNVGIGDTSPSYPLDIDDLSTTRALNINTTAATTGVIYGVFVNNQNTATGTTSERYGLFTRVRVPTGEANKAYGTYNELTGAGGTGDQIGTYNRMIGNEDRNMTGVNNYFTAAGDGEHIGTNNNISSTGTGDHTGTQNQMRGSGTVRGVYNTFSSASGNGNNRGVSNSFTNNGSGTQQGIYTSISGTGTGAHIGVSNFISSSGNNNHSGVINTLSSSSSGVHTGIFNNINSSTGHNYGLRNEIDNTASTKTSYGTYNWLSNNAGTAYGGWFDITSGTGDAYGGWFSATGSGTNYAAVFNDGLVVINESGNDNDFRVESNGKANMLFVDAGSNEVGIGTDDPLATLDVRGSATFNYQNGNKNFSVHSQNNNYTLHVDANVDNVGINKQYPGYTLDVGGDINTSGTFRKSGTDQHPDYVFETYFDGFSKYNKEYSIKSLEEIVLFLKENKHLPNIQSREDVMKNGWDVGEGVRDNLEKVEELFLHAIEANKKIEALEDENQLLKDNLNQTLQTLELLNKRLEVLEKNKN